MSLYLEWFSSEGGQTNMAATSTSKTSPQCEQLNITLKVS